MQENIDGIRELKIKKDNHGKYIGVRIIFGPHHVVEIFELQGKITFDLRATHHGFRADASSVPSELERFIEEIRRNHPENVVD